MPGDLTFSLSEVSISSIMSQITETSSISCTLLVSLASEVPVRIPKIFISQFPIVWVSFIHFISTFSTRKVLLFSSIVCLCFHKCL